VPRGCVRQVRPYQTWIVRRLSSMALSPETQADLAYGLFLLDHHYSFHVLNGAATGSGNL
jgi:hypothetical protein